MSCGGSPRMQRVRVVRTRKSSTSLRPGIRYDYHPEVSNNNLVYIRKPESIRNPAREQQSRPIPIIYSKRQTKRSCVNRFCAGVLNFFRFRSTTVGYKEELRYPSPAPFAHYALPFQSSSMTLEPNIPSPSRASLMNHGGWQKEETFQSDEGDYIIYVPRMSRADLQKRYVDPLRQSSSNMQPVIIRPLCRQCVGCQSCNFERGRTDENALRNQTRECSDHVLIQQRKKSRFSTSCHTSMENIITKNKNQPTTTGNNNENDQASGDTRENCQQKNKPVPIMEMIEDSKNKKSFQIIMKMDVKKFNPRAFKLRDKIISWDLIHERHFRAARNRQRIMQESRDKLQTHFAIWMRRKRIGQMKKKLAGAKDKENNSLAITPPNMLESRYHHIHRLGKNQNSNNSVGRYFDKEDNKVVALKIFGDVPYETMVENLDNKLMAIQEINCLKTLENKNIVKLLGYFELQDKYHLILESCDRSLREEIEKHPSGLGMCISKKLIKNVVSGLSFCHDKNCLHRDLSPENILVCKNGVAKIGDFDRAVFLNQEGMGTASPTPGSYVYNSPEILAGDKKYGLPSDVWSVGVIFCEILFGKPPWNGKSAKFQLREIHNCVGPLLPRHASIAKLPADEKRNKNKSYAVNNHAQLQQWLTTISSNCSSFIMKCLDVNPLCRFTCGELLSHKFIKGK